MEGPPSTRYPVVLITIRISNRPSASRRRLRRTIELSPPFVDQIRHQATPPRLMAGSQTHSAVAVVVLVEEQTLVPVRIILKFAVETETGTLTVRPTFENRDHDRTISSNNSGNSDLVRLYPFHPAKSIDSEVRGENSRTRTIGARYGHPRREPLPLRWQGKAQRYDARLRGHSRRVRRTQGHPIRIRLPARRPTAAAGRQDRCAAEPDP